MVPRINTKHLKLQTCKAEFLTCGTTGLWSWIITLCTVGYLIASLLDLDPLDASGNCHPLIHLGGENQKCL